MQDLFFIVYYDPVNALLLIYNATTEYLGVKVVVKLVN